LLPPLARGLDVAEELGQFDATGTLVHSNNGGRPRESGGPYPQAFVVVQIYSYRVRKDDAGDYGSRLALAVLARPGRRSICCTLRRRIDRRFLAPELALAQKDIEPGANDDRGADNRIP
jgi:hypothetical protein